MFTYDFFVGFLRNDLVKLSLFLLYFLLFSLRCGLKFWYTADIYYAFYLASSEEKSYSQGGGVIYWK